MKSMVKILFLRTEELQSDWPKSDFSVVACGQLATVDTASPQCRDQWANFLFLTLSCSLFWPLISQEMLLGTGLGANSQYRSISTPGKY